MSAASGSWRSSPARSSSGSSAPATAPPSPRPCALSSSARSAASASTTSTSATRTSGRASSRSAPTSRTRPRSGSTGTSGPSARPTTRASTTSRCPTGSPPAPQPERLQAICDSFGARHVQAFFDRWMACIPTPFTAADRAAGYWWELSMRQVEVSRTLVFDDPRRARSFFEALVADNIAIGRPEQVAMVFARQVRKTDQGPVPHPRLRSRHRRQDRLLLQALADQAVPQGRPRAAHRDRHQQAHRPRRPRPPRAPARADRQGAADQPPAAYHRACRSELCHRLCAV